MSDIPPCQTLYINNLNEKIKKAPLKKALYEAFSQFGRILEIVTTRGEKMRGQAWICFESVEAATNAMAKFQGNSEKNNSTAAFLLVNSLVSLLLSELSGHPFFDKPMRVSYAKAKSDIVAKKDGSYRPREKNAYAAAPAPAPMETTAAPQRITAPDASAPPSNILFAQNLPADCTAAALSMLFTVHVGFKEVRMIPGKPGIAFIEFDEETRASTAMQALNGFRLTPTDAMTLTYAKR